MNSRRGRIAALVLASAGVAAILAGHWMAAFWVRTEAEQGVVQRIFYVHVPAAWTTFLAVAIVALASGAYLWLEDERADAAAAAAAEGSLIFGAVMLITGPLWGRIAWGTYWTWEPRLTLTLILWFTYLGYFLVRGSVADPRRGKRFAAVVAVVGSLNIPLIHVSVQMFRSLHPGPVVIKPEGPTLPSDMLATLLTFLAGFTMLFMGLFILRYAVERLHGRAPPVGNAETGGALT
ncbi:MAG: cytochrome c biogenesis protein CcsA [Gemmatimonadota bacterium]|nr:cytochrome c biogenesis protein CcsA [Gemmatimonadota bacterium]